MQAGRRPESLPGYLPLGEVKGKRPSQEPDGYSYTLSPIPIPAFLQPFPGCRSSGWGTAGPTLVFSLSEPQGTLMLLSCPAQGRKKASGLIHRWVPIFKAALSLGPGCGHRGIPKTVFAGNTPRHDQQGSTTSYGCPDPQFGESPLTSLAILCSHSGLSNFSSV